MQPMLNIAVRAARSAGNVIIRNLGRLESLNVYTKDRNDFVTDVDRQAEREIIAVLRKAYPNHGILAEESGHHDGDRQWLRSVGSPQSVPKRHCWHDYHYSSAARSVAANPVGVTCIPPNGSSL